jgi:hypothetical protein
LPLGGVSGTTGGGVDVPRDTTVLEAAAELVRARLEEDAMIRRVGLRYDAPVGGDGAVGVAVDDVLVQLRRSFGERLLRELRGRSVVRITLLRDRRENRGARGLLALATCADGETQRLGARRVAVGILEMDGGAVEVVGEERAAPAVVLLRRRLETIRRGRLVRVRARGDCRSGERGARRCHHQDRPRPSPAPHRWRIQRVEAQGRLHAISRNRRSGSSR